MKKLLVVLAMIPMGVMAQQKEKEKTYKVELTLTQWSRILQVIDDSRDHQLVKESQALVLPQLQAKLDEEKKEAEKKNVKKEAKQE